VENLNDMMCFLGSGKQEESDTTENGGWKSSPKFGLFEKFFNNISVSYTS
jgi:hypothetical protein